MPTNVPPEYKKVEALYREATSNEERIAYIEEMLSIIPKHKGTDHLRADWRRRLSKLKEAAESRKGGARQSSPLSCGSGRCGADRGDRAAQRGQVQLAQCADQRHPRCC